MKEWLETQIEWKDEQRRKALKSKLPDKEINPTEYNKRIEFWSKAFVKAVDESLVFDKSRMKDLYIDYDKVLQVMLSNKTIVPSNFYSLRYYFTILPSKFVVLEALQRKASEILNKITINNYSDAIYSKEQFIRKYQISAVDAKVLLEYLVHHKRIEINSDDIIVFTTNKQIPTIVNKSIASIKQTLDNLHTQMQSLDDKLALLLKSIKLTNANRSMKLSQLKQMKGLEAIKQKRMDHVLNLSIILLQIDTRIQDNEILNLYESTTTSLKELLSKTSVERVENVMDELDDVFAAQQEIDQAMTMTDTGESIELEAELEALEREAKQEEKTKIESIINTLDQLNIVETPVKEIGTKQIDSDHSLQAELA